MRNVFLATVAASLMFASSALAWESVEQHFGLVPHPAPVAGDPGYAAVQSADWAVVSTFTDPDFISVSENLGTGSLSEIGWEPEQTLVPQDFSGLAEYNGIVGVQNSVVGLDGAVQFTRDLQVLNSTEINMAAHYDPTGSAVAGATLTGDAGAQKISGGVVTFNNLDAQILATVNVSGQPDTVLANASASANGQQTVDYQSGGFTIYSNSNVSVQNSSTWN